MKQLTDILQKVNHQTSENHEGLMVSGITSDSRAIQEGGLFCAIKGGSFDGHSVIESLHQFSTLIIICEVLPNNIINGHTYIQVTNSRAAWGRICANWFEVPSQELSVVGITGTNGKTSVTSMLFQVFESLGYTCGLISTIEIKIGKKVIPTTHTTPDAFKVQETLREMANNGVSHVFMEVSSHALDQYRVEGVDFSVAGFTNISHDHLDYHLSFKSYIDAKKILFDSLSNTATAIVNIDDKRGAIMLQNCSAQHIEISTKGLGKTECKILEQTFEGLHLMINGQEFHTPLVGKFNVYNLLMVLECAKALDEDEQEILAALSQVKAAKGRFQVIQAKPNGVKAIVDYAHTPDALLNVLQTLQETINHTGGRIISVLGCGGNRDQEKRPKMARIAEQFSQKVFLTSDNPRNEDPTEILNQMQTGIQKPEIVSTIIDREKAILSAIGYSEAGDCVLVAGKGHESYQEINGLKHPFDDAEIVLTNLKMLNK